MKILSISSDEEKQLQAILTSHPVWSKRLHEAYDFYEGAPKSQLFSNSDIENIKLTERIHELENEVKSLKRIIES